MRLAVRSSTNPNICLDCENLTIDDSPRELAAEISRSNESSPFLPQINVIEPVLFPISEE